MRLGDGEVGLGPLRRHLVGAGIDLQQRLPGLDAGPFGEIYFYDLAADLGLEQHRGDGLDRADG